MGLIGLSESKRNWITHKPNLTQVNRLYDHNFTHKISGLELPNGSIVEDSCLLAENWSILSSDLNFEQEFVAAKHEVNIGYLPSNKNRKQYLCIKASIFTYTSKRQILRL